MGKTKLDAYKERRGYTNDGETILAVAAFSSFADIFHDDKIILSGEVLEELGIKSQMKRGEIAKVLDGLKNSANEKRTLLIRAAVKRVMEMSQKPQDSDVVEAEANTWFDKVIEGIRAFCEKDILGEDEEAEPAV
jgi:hypothetical protein